MQTQRNPDTIHPPLAGYSHQIEISGPQRQLVIAGQIGMRPDGEVPEDPIDQLGAALDNVERNLEAAGMQFGDLVRLTIYLVGEWDANARRQLVASRLGAHHPCTTLLYVAGLAAPNLRVELDAWASADA
ncbi:MAG TPA: RidA family protein [Gaiellales bacterium]|jgi:enamine deaminase RidA (YjgF/YER057c/UK114 family)